MGAACAIFALLFAYEFASLLFTKPQLPPWELMKHPQPHTVAEWAELALVLTVIQFVSGTWLEIVAPVLVLGVVATFAARHLRERTSPPDDQTSK